MRLSIAVFLCVFAASNAKAHVLYDFVVACKAASLAACFQSIEAQLDDVRAEQQGKSFCIPPIWGAGLMPSTSYPVSMLDYLLLRLSAARVGRAGQPVRIVLRDTLAELYPCRTAAPEE
jgi:hypothetical protein